MDLLNVKALAVGYGTKIILEDVNLPVGLGQFIGIVAPNGAGKSTLLKTIAGILPPLKGQILLRNKPLSCYNRRELAKQMAVVGNDIAELNYTALQMVFMGRFAHIPRFANASAADQAIVQSAMEDVGIWDKRSCLCPELSQGEKQKVIIARALAQQPELLLLDEPTAHLDICNQYNILQLIKNVARCNKMAVVAVIHDINLALNFSTHLLFLKDGRVLDYGLQQEVMSPAILKKVYDMDFTLHGDTTAAYVRPMWGEIG